MQHLAGCQAALIGRQEEMAELDRAWRELLHGQGAIVSIAGEMGTGKSRLIKEFKSTLDLPAVRWYEGHATADTANVPYYLFIDLLKRIFEIQAGDLPEQTREKAETKVLATIEGERDVMAYLGNLFSVHYPELESIDIDVLRLGLRQALVTFLDALLRQGPTVICLEDLHWADPTSLELLQLLWAKQTCPALFLCSYRPPLALMGPSPPPEVLKLHHRMELKNLSPLETRQMVASLLQNGKIPPSLEQVVLAKVAGNPFYVEELVNSLIETKILFFAAGNWHLQEPGDAIRLPATVRELISARVEQLDAATREVLQEAAVIGRSFFLDILADITAGGKLVAAALDSLRDLNIIEIESAHPNPVYCFRHAMFQETVYHGIPPARRRDLHEKVGRALEKYFQQWSLEPWETLAFHFQRGHNADRAVAYLLQSGEKSLKKYALEASAQYYGEAFNLLSQRPERSPADSLLLLNLLIKWCLVLYYQGHFKEMSRLLLDHLYLAESLHGQGKLGEYYAWLGHATFWHGASLTESYRYLHKALELAEQSGNKQVEAYASGFLIKTCAELGLLEESVAQAERCLQRLVTTPEDYFLNMIYYSGMAYIGWFTGDKNRVRTAGRDLLDYGRLHQSLRCQMVGHVLLSFWRFMDLDTAGAVADLQKVIAEGDPYHAAAARGVLGMMLVHMRQFDAALDQLRQVVRYSEEHGTEYLKTFANIFLGVTLAAQGSLAAGLGLIENSNQEFMDFHRQVFHCMSETILGTVYLQLYQRSGKKSVAMIWHNLGIILQNLFTAGKKAEKHFLNAVRLAQQTGARGFLGQPYLQLGVLYKIRGNKEKARQYLLTALETFTACDLPAYLQRTRELLQTLD